MQKRHMVRIEFNVHVDPELVQSWLCGVKACGTVSQTNERTYLVDVRRDAKYRSLKCILANMESGGSASWYEIPAESLTP